MRDASLTHWVGLGIVNKIKNWSPVQANFVVKIKRVPKRLSAQNSVWRMTGMSPLLGRDTTTGLLACERRRPESEEQSGADLSRRCNLSAVLVVVIHDLEAGRASVWRRNRLDRDKHLREMRPNHFRSMFRMSHACFQSILATIGTFMDRDQMTILLRFAQTDRGKTGSFPRYRELILVNNQLSVLSSGVFAGLSSLQWVCVFLVAEYWDTVLEWKCWLSIITWHTNLNFGLRGIACRVTGIPRAFVCHTSCWLQYSRPALRIAYTRKSLKLFRLAQQRSVRRHRWCEWTPLTKSSSKNNFDSARQSFAWSYPTCWTSTEASSLIMLACPWWIFPSVWLTRLSYGSSVSVNWLCSSMFGPFIVQFNTLSVSSLLYLYLDICMCICMYIRRYTDI